MGTGTAARRMALAGLLVAAGCHSTQATGPTGTSSGGSPSSSVTGGSTAGLEAGSSGQASSGQGTLHPSAATASSAAGATGSGSSSGLASGSSASQGSATGTASGSSGASGTSDAGYLPCPAGGVCTPPDTCSASGYCLPPGGCVDRSDCSTGEFCDAGDCQPGGQCGGQQIPSAPVPPNLLFTVDRSCSMRQVPSGAHSADGGGSKWDLAVEAITHLMVELDGGAQFGLTVFPTRDAGGGGSCNVPVPLVSVAPGTEGEITALLAAALVSGDPNYPDGPCVTPIDSGLWASSQEPALADPTHPSFLILITDGEQTSCNLHGGATGCVDTITSLLQQTPSVGTFVIGFGSQVNATQLSDFANAGGEPVDGGTEPYYQAQDLTSLESALKAISSKAGGCVIGLQSVPPNPDQLDVYFQVGTDYTFVASDGGWRYDSATNEIVLLAGACQLVQQGGVTSVDVEYGCLR